MYNLSLFSFFDQYSLFVYSLQQYFIRNLISTYSYYQPIVYLVFISLGFITVLTPCFFSMLPLLFLSINSRHNVGNSLFYCILGLVTSFCFFVFVTHSFSFTAMLSQLPLLSYLILVIFSLDFMKILNLSSVYYSLLSTLNFSYRQTFNLSTYITGLLVGLSSLPCSTPILLVVNLLLLSNRNTFFVVLSIICYFIGFILSFFCIFHLKFLYDKFQFFSVFWDYFVSTSGSLLFIITFSSFLKVLFT